MKKCPRCGADYRDKCICKTCGYDESMDYERYKTLAPIPKKILKQNNAKMVTSTSQQIHTEGTLNVKKQEESNLANKKNSFIKIAMLLGCGIGVIAMLLLALTFFGTSKEQDSSETDTLEVQQDEINPLDTWQDVKRYPMMSDKDGSGEDTAKVFGSEYLRTDISEIRFLNTMEGVPADSWDISADASGNVKAWVDAQNVLYIAADGIVLAPYDCSFLFSWYKNVKTIDFNQCFDTSQVTNMDCMFQACESMTSVDVEGFDTSEVLHMEGMFSLCKSLTNVDVSGFNTSNVGNMNSMFQGCNALTYLDVSGFDTSKVKDMASMFAYCKSLTSLDISGFDMSNVKYTDKMFQGCSFQLNDGIMQESGSTSILMSDAEGFEFYDDELCKVFGSEYLRKNITEIQFLNSTKSAPAGEGWDVSADGSGSVIAWVKNSSKEAFSDSEDIVPQVLYIAADGMIQAPEDCEFLFAGYENVHTIEFNHCFDTSQVKNMGYMFSYCESLPYVDISDFDTSQVTSLSTMFNGCSSLTSVDVSGFDTSQVTKLRNMFYGCESLASVDVSGFDTSKVTDMCDMFHGCSSLTSIDVSGFDTSQVTDMSGLFMSCTSLTSVDVSGFDTSQVNRMGWMFYGCDSLESVDVSGFDISKAETMIGMFGENTTPIVGNSGIQP